ncbi:MAG: OmpA family protein [Burkholderiales bacterium]
MQQNWISVAVVMACLGVATPLTGSSAEQGGVLPPPSLFDDPPSQERAAQAPTDTPAPPEARPQPAPASAPQASMPEPEETSEPPRKSVWWKPWTWGSRKAKAPAPTPTSPAAQASQSAETQPAPDQPAMTEKASAPAAPPPVVEQQVLNTTPPEEVSRPAPVREIQTPPPPKTSSLDKPKEHVAVPSPPQRAPVASSAAAKPKPVAGSAKPAAPKGDRPLSMSSEAWFAYNSSALDVADKKLLDEMAAKLANGDYQTVRIAGHTDRIETAEHGDKLSLLRAQAVKQHLVLKGLDARRIAVSGQGAGDPVAPATQCGKLAGQALHACLAPDRRAEIIVTRALAKKPGGHVVRQ